MAEVPGASGFPSKSSRLNAVVCSRVRGLREALSSATIALEISSRNRRVAALQERWDRLRAGLELILAQRGADMADLPVGASRLLCRDYKGREADRLVTRIDPGIISLVAELGAHDRQAAEEMEQSETHHEEHKAGFPIPLSCEQHGAKGIKTGRCQYDFDNAVSQAVIE